jgi:hypothetical protein
MKCCLHFENYLFEKGKKREKEKEEEEKNTHTRKGCKISQ